MAAVEKGLTQFLSDVSQTLSKVSAKPLTFTSEDEYQQFVKSIASTLATWSEPALLGRARGIHGDPAGILSK